MNPGGLSEIIVAKSQLIALALAACAAASPSRAAEGPYGKTFIGSARVCSARTGQCLPTTPIHVFLARSGRLYSYLRSEGGEVFPLGRFLTFGATQQRFLVSGTTLVYEDVFDQDGSRVVLRGYLRAQGGVCAISGSATVNGAPEPITLDASCQVYEGQR